MRCSIILASLLVQQCAAFLRTRIAVVPRVRLDSWNADIDWKSSSILDVKQAAEGMYSITLQAADPSSFVNPGQYCQLRVGSEEKAGFFAIASAPSVESPTWELLVKRPADPASAGYALCDAKAGATFDCSPAMGKGFPIASEINDMTKYDGFLAQQIYLLCTGSGIAPIRSVIESGVLQSQFDSTSSRPITLYWGVQSPAHAPWQSEFDRWQSEFGVDIKLCFSNDGPGNYVQDRLKADGVARPRNSAALIVGQKPMFEGCKEILSKAGVFEGRICSNF